MKANKKEQILLTARQIFLEKGYIETKISDIAHVSGISTATIYSYFSGKRELFEVLNIPDCIKKRPQYDSQKSFILEKALQLFAQKGYQATSLDLIAKTCGFSKSVLYQYFESKEVLFSSLFYEPFVMDNFDNVCLNPLHTPLPEALELLGTLFLDLFDQPERLNLTKIIISEANRFPNLSTLMYDNTIQVVVTYFSSYLRQLAELEQIVCVNPILATRSYFGMLYSFVITDRIIAKKPYSFSKEEIVKFAVCIFIKGLT